MIEFCFMVTNLLITTKTGDLGMVIRANNLKGACMKASRNHIQHPWEKWKISGVVQKQVVCASRDYGCKWEDIN